MDPCIQAPAIKRVDEKLDQALEALSALAVQKNEIEHLIKTEGDHREWLKNHESRLQSLEKQPGKIAIGALLLLASAAGSIVAGMIVFFLTKGP